MNKKIPNKTIFKDQLEELFSNIKKVEGFEDNKPMLWGYFFTDSDPEKLERAIPKLEKKGLTFVDIFYPEYDPEDDDIEIEPVTHWLHMEEVIVHTVETLDKKNDEFFIFADEEGLESYDGMDVGFVEDDHL